jgi:dephospho-CoA kinase
MPASLNKILKPRVLGITGGIGSGKSTVAFLFAQLGAAVIDADKIARRLLWQNGICFPTVVALFGKKILTGGRIDRKKLASIVFGDSVQRRKLEEIIHPQVKRMIRQRILGLQKKRSIPLIVAEIPLLYEAGLDQEVDKVIVVQAEHEQQIHRSARKGTWSPEVIEQRIKAQMPMSQKLKKADFIIDNRGTIHQTKQQVRAIWDCYVSK